MMNIAKFVVLGTLDILKEASGYDIFRYLEAKMIGRWTDIKKGSIYNALKTLEKNGNIKETGRVKSGQYPTMTLYQITDTGRETFDKMQETAFLGLFPSFIGFKLALKFNNRRSREEIKDFAVAAMDVIERHIRGMDAYLNGLSDPSAQKRSDAFFIMHDRKLMIQEKQWIQDVHQALDEGEDSPLSGFFA